MKINEKNYLIKYIEEKNLYINIENIKFDIDKILENKSKIKLINLDFYSLSIKSFINKYFYYINDINDIIENMKIEENDIIDEKSMRIINQFREDYKMIRLIDKEIEEKIKIRDRYKNLIRDINLEYLSNYYDYQSKINIMKIMIKYKRLENENQSIINQLYKDREEYRYLK
jgi:hypothetical protein